MTMYKQYLIFLLFIIWRKNIKIKQIKLLFQGKKINPEVQEIIKIKLSQKSLENMFFCQQKKQAKQFCLNQNCQQKCSYLCNDDNCMCQQKHQMCQRGRLASIQNKINIKLKTPFSFKEQISSFFDLAIAQLNSIRNKVLIQLQEKTKYFQLTGLEKQFMSVIQKKNQQSTLNSKKFAQLWTTITSLQQNQKINEIYINSIKSECFQDLNFIKKNLMDNISTIPKKFEAFMKIFNQKITTKEQESVHFISKNLSTRQQSQQIQIAQSLYSQSPVLEKNIHLIDRLLKFFKPKELKKINKLFQASQHNFQIQKYFQKCKTQINTIILCRTSQYKVIGAFTPLAINPTDTSQWIKDDSGTSFIFSLTNNDKFCLQDKDHVLYLQKSRIKFGNDEFNMGNSANKQKSARADVNCSFYSNPNYTKNDQQAFLRFNGTNQQSFTVKQWEVWKIQFIQQK